MYPATLFRFPRKPAAGLVVLTMLLHLLLTPAATLAAQPAPDPETKNGPAEQSTPSGGDSFLAELPPLGSKNYDGGEVATDAGEAALDAAPVPGSKNFEPGDGTSATPEGLLETLATYGTIIGCGQSGNANWTTTSGSFQQIRRCSLTLPGSGWVFLSANGSLARQNGEFEAQFRIGINSTTGDANIDRWVNVYNDSGDGTDKSVALTVMQPVSAGPKTFYFLGKRYSGSGTVLVYDPTLTVIFIPSTDTDIRRCAQSGNVNWTTTSSSFQVIRQCTMNLPRSGFVFIASDGSAARQNGPYEGQFRIGIDSTSGDANVDRWVNVYNDSGDGTDESAAISVIKPVSAGSHTFYSLGKRYGGSATMLVYDPTLSVIYVPARTSTMVHCQRSGNANWTTTSGAFQIIRQCNVKVPQAGWAFLSADGTVARQNGTYEAQFRIGIDSTGGDWNVDRWVNVYNDSGDGSDRNMALSVLKPISAGTHTFYLLGRRYSGSSTMLVYDPTLSVIVPGGRFFLPEVPIDD